MEYHVFISYAQEDNELIENFRGRLKECGVNAWVYSIDRTLADDTWEEIKTRIQMSRVVIFAISSYTADAQGQKRELEIAFNKIQQTRLETRIFPLALRNTSFSAFPEKLQRINGYRLDAFDVMTIARKISMKFFPELFREQLESEWRYPVPGQWVEVCELDGLIEEYFDIGDQLYFRRISPLGLFECYSPKIKELFWIGSEWVKPSLATGESETEREKQVPYVYQISGMIEIEQLGYDEMQRKKERQ